MFATPTPVVLDWLHRLIAIDTTSRLSSLALIDAVADHARTFGFTVHRFLSPDGQKANLVVSCPDKDGSIDGGIMLAGHSDCVPVDGQMWSSDPFQVVERDGRLYGRGTADMKGFDAVIVAAMERLAARPLAEPVHIALTYDEESGCLGAQPLMDSMAEANLHPRVAFVGEPTSMRMIRGHKAINLVRISLTGVSAHSSLPHLGVNAVQYAADIVSYWRRQQETWRDDGPFDEAYLVPHTTGSVNQIAGGTAVNVVPEHCEVVLEFRSIAETNPQETLANLAAFCADIERRMQAEDASASVTIETMSSTPGLDTGLDADAVRLGHELGLELCTDKVTYGTEAGIYSNAGISTVVCGPGDIAQAHKPDEFVSLDQLGLCETFINRLIAELQDSA